MSPGRGTATSGCSAATGDPRAHGTPDRCGISPRWPTALRDLVDREDATDLRVVNLSFGAYRHSRLAEDAIRHAAGQGIVVVASAGNAATNAAHYPSDYQVLSVAAADRHDQALADSNYGPDIDLAVTGERSGSLRLRYLAGLDRAASDPHPDGRPQERGETYGEGHSNHLRAAQPTEVKRLAGANRLDTAVAIREEVFRNSPQDVDRVLVVPANGDGASPSDPLQGWRTALPAASLLNDGRTAYVVTFRDELAEQARGELLALIDTGDEIVIVAIPTCPSRTRSRPRS